MFKAIFSKPALFKQTNYKQAIPGKNARKRVTASLSIMALTLTGFAGSANADHRYAKSYQQDWDYAKVSSVEPIYQTVSHRVPAKQCWMETVRVDHDHGYKSNTGTIVGGIVGAAIGNRLGHHKRNKQVGAVAGAILGASIGADISAKNRNQRSVVSEYRDVERCETHYQTEYEERLIGYNVSYRYHGRTYHTRTDRHPGKRIKVAVSVRPAF